MPIDSPRLTVRTKARMAGVSQRSAMSVRACSVEMPSVCCLSARRNSSPRAPLKRAEMSPIDPVKPMPASTVATSRSISSGSCASIVSKRAAPRRRIVAEGSAQPAATHTITSTRISSENLAPTRAM